MKGAALRRALANFAVLQNAVVISKMQWFGF
jgi:hypothetical protein